MTASTAFAEEVDRYRPELTAHCYRMLGSVHDAEDVVQETCLRAWRAREQYDPTRSALRTWLYRIATNACLTALDGRQRRPLPSGLVAASDPTAPLQHGGEVPWLQPLPDSLLRLGDPASTIIERGSLRLAFVAAMQQLSPRERAVLILREVLEFSAAESADILDLTPAAINSALQRARTRLTRERLDAEDVPQLSDADKAEWVDRYVEAFTTADVAALKQLVTDDVLMEMPPMLNWFTGRTGYGVFMDWVFEAAGHDWRFQPVAANGQPGFAAYRRGADGYEVHTLQVFTVREAGICRITVFQDDEVFAMFGLARTLPA